MWTGAALRGCLGRPIVHGHLTLAIPEIGRPKLKHSYHTIRGLHHFFAALNLPSGHLIWHKSKPLPHIHHINVSFMGSDHPQKMLDLRQYPRM